MNITCKSPKTGERAEIDEYYASTESMRGTNFSGFYHWFLFPVEQLARGTKYLEAFHISKNGRPKIRPSTGVFGTKRARNNPAAAFVLTNQYFLIHFLS